MAVAVAPLPHMRLYAYSARPRPKLWPRSTLASLFLPTLVPRLVGAESSVETGSGPGAKGDAGGSCLGHPRSSPVDIVPWSAVPADSSFRANYYTWLHQDLDRQVIDGGLGSNLSIRLRFKNESGGGAAQVGNSYFDAGAYVLRAIEVHMPSQHTFNGRTLPVELQLWHEPSIFKDLHGLREQRRRVQETLAALYTSAARWSQEVHNVRNASYKLFPSIRTEEDWVNLERHQVDLHGEDLVHRAHRLREEIVGIDNLASSLISTLRRPSSARVVVLSILFRASDLSTPPQSQADTFFRWLRGAIKPPNDLPRDGLDGSSSFDFNRFYYKGTKDLEGKAMQSAFAYEGGRTEPPCTPDVNWLVASEPCVAYGEDILGLLPVLPNSSASSVALLGGPMGSEVWWNGPVQSAPLREPPLPRGEITSVEISTIPFKVPPPGLGSSRLAGYSWSFINQYCAAFLVCSVLMLCAACGICFTWMCEQ